jgi:hypothetical protein
MADEEDEKTRLIRRKTPPEVPASSADPDEQSTRVLEPETVDGDMTKLVGPARRSATAEAASSQSSYDGGELDPVVGWLVVLAGPGRGNARRLGYGQNSLGRDKGERVSLDFGDGSISRSKHAFVLYEPRKRQYFIRPGDGANLTYLNGELLAESRPLTAADVIEVGATKLKFVPLCGPEFDWEDQATAPK